MPTNGSGAPTVVTHVSGARFAIRIRSHEILVDQTIRGGGEDSAPTPIELLGAALGSCVAYYVSEFLRARNLSREGMQVEVVQTKGTNPSRVTDFDVRLVLPASVGTGHLMMIERVVHACPVHNTLAAGSSVRVAIESAAAQPA